jgi:hypothetical protein
MKWLPYWKVKTKDNSNISGMTTTYFPDSRKTQNPGLTFYATHHWNPRTIVQRQKQNKQLNRLHKNKTLFWTRIRKDTSRTQTPISESWGIRTSSFRLCDPTTMKGKGVPRKKKEEAGKEKKNR